MQGLADGYFVLPIYHRWVSGWNSNCPQVIRRDHDAFKASVATCTERTEKLLSIQGSNEPWMISIVSWVRIMWDYCGMSRSNEGLEKARGMIQNLEV